MVSSLAARPIVLTTRQIKESPMDTAVNLVRGVLGAPTSWRSAFMRIVKPCCVGGAGQPVNAIPRRDDPFVQSLKATMTCTPCRPKNVVELSTTTFAVFASNALELTVLGRLDTKELTLAQHVWQPRQRSNHM